MHPPPDKNVLNYFAPAAQVPAEETSGGMWSAWFLLLVLFGWLLVLIGAFVHGLTLAACSNVLGVIAGITGVAQSGRRRVAVVALLLHLAFAVFVAWAFAELFYHC